MTVKKPTNKAPKKPAKKILKTPNKLNVWLSYYIDASNPRTYLNKTESARAAGYKTKIEQSLATIGCENYRKLYVEIEKWLDEQGLSENSLKTKLLSLMDAKETKFFAHEGVVTDEREVEALEIQRRALDMAFKVKGSYESDKAVENGLDKLGERLAKAIMRTDGTGGN